MYVSRREAQHPMKTYFNSPGNGIRCRKVKRSTNDETACDFCIVYRQKFAPKVLQSVSPRILRSAGARTARRAHVGTSSLSRSRNFDIASKIARAS